MQDYECAAATGAERHQQRIKAGENTGVLNKMKISKTMMMVKMKSSPFVRYRHTGVVGSEETTTRRRSRRRRPAAPDRAAYWRSIYYFPDLN